MIESLYREHNTWLKHWLRSRLSCPDRACDLAQETWLRMLAQDNPPQPRVAKAYLSTIARGLMIDLFRRQPLEQAWLEALQQRPEATAGSPETHHQIIEALVAIDQMLDQLGERTRQMFLMAQLDGLSHAKISRRLNISPSTVRKHCIRALTECLQLVEDLDESDH